MYIVDPAEVVTISDYKEPVVEHSELKLTCNASGGNPNYYTYEWRFEPTYGGDIKNNEGKMQILTVSDALYTDDGRYVCESTNMAGSHIASQNVSIHCKYNDSYICYMIKKYIKYMSMF